MRKKAVDSELEVKQQRFQQGKRKAYAKKEQNRGNKRPKFSNEFIDNFFEKMESKDEGKDFQSWLSVPLSSELLVQIVNFYPIFFPFNQDSGVEIGSMFKVDSFLRQYLAFDCS